MITGEAVVGVHGRRDVVDHVTRGDRYFERVGVARWALEFNGKLARLFRFQEAAGFHSQHARANQQQPAGILGVIPSFEGVMEAEGLVCMVQILYASLSDIKSDKEPASRSSMGLT